MTPAQFKSWRKRLNFSQDDAADFLGLSVGTIGNYEAGQRREGGEVEIPLTVALACVAISLGFENYVEKDEIIKLGATPQATSQDQFLAALGVAQDERVYKGDVISLEHRVKFLESSLIKLDQHNTSLRGYIKDVYSYSKLPIPGGLLVKF